MPSVNDMGFNQISSVLTEITRQATGQTEIAPINNTADFVSVAQTALKAGFDPILNAISQMVSRTIFAVRPYERKFPALFVDNAAYGNHVRKINYIDSVPEDDEGYKLTDSAAVDMYRVRKPQVVQTNFYGQDTYQDSVTIFRDQLKNAFDGPEQLGSFISNLLLEISNKHEQFHESLARACVANFIGGKISGDTSNVIHLLTEYKAATGLDNLTAVTVYQPENFPAFVRWLAARIAAISDQMTERSIKFHTNLDSGRVIMRHTPKADQRVYMYSPLMRQIETMVASDTFNADLLRLPSHEAVNFWQNIDDPDQIQITPTFLLPNGTIDTASAPVEQSGVVGVIFDREAIGISTYSQEMSVTPYNSRGRYNNLYWHFTDRYWNDFTENGVVLLLD